MLFAASQAVIDALRIGGIALIVLALILLLTLIKGRTKTDQAQLDPLFEKYSHLDQSDLSQLNEHEQAIAILIRRYKAKEIKKAEYKKRLDVILEQQRMEQEKRTR